MAFMVLMPIRCCARKAMVDALIFSQSMLPEDLQFEDEALLNILLEDLNTPDATQRLQPFSPILVNVIRQFLTQP